jgi:hypothetical protein
MIHEEKECWKTKEKDNLQHDILIITEQVTEKLDGLKHK